MYIMYISISKLIPIEYIDLFYRGESQLRFIPICSIRIRSRDRDFFKESLELKIQGFGRSNGPTCPRKKCATSGNAKDAGRTGSNCDFIADCQN